MVWHRFLREPLLHFLVAGAVLLAVSVLFGQSVGVGTDQHRIHVRAAKIEQLRETWTRQRGAAPTAEQLRRLVEDFIREEVLYREAITSGLDRDDTIVRRRLAQKVEFLAQSVASTVEPSDAELGAFFEVNREHYAIPAKVGFSHVYFSRSSREATAEEAARGTLVRLTSGQTSDTEVSQLGDRFMLQHDYPPQTREQISDLFGPQFAAAVFELSSGEWAGPIASSYGVHLVRVRQRMPPRLPTLAEVRRQVTLDFNEQRLRVAADAYYERLRQRFEIVVDDETLVSDAARGL